MLLARQKSNKVRLQLPKTKTLLLFTSSSFKIFTAKAALARMKNEAIQFLGLTFMQRYHSNMPNV